MAANASLLGLVLAGVATFVVGAPAGAVAPEPAASAVQAPDLNFNLFPSAAPKQQSSSASPAVDLAAIKRRRLMLQLHQSFGIALLATTIGSVITGQLSYDDKFYGNNSGRYELSHDIFVYPTEGLALVAAGLAIFAPVPIEKRSVGFDRMTLHKIGEFTAFGGWLAELVLGLVTAVREGYANQRWVADVHLGIGYLTLAGMTVGVGAIVF